jgi:CDP-diacylglycerol---glycerol-3-phosphate 3-phosphatidyltransferase
MTTTRDRLQHLLHKILNPVVKLFISAGITPNIVTTIGLALNISVAVIFIIGAEYGRRDDLSYIGWAGAMILFAGIFDMIDGQVARLGRMASRFGALYDSVLDRYSEMIMFLGICYYLVAHNYFMSSIIAFIGMIGSIMVSYTRARAEGLGIPCKEGLMQRPERIITIGAAAVFTGIMGDVTGGNQKWQIPGQQYTFESIAFFTIPLTVIAILANYTAIQRLRACYRFLNEIEKDREVIK